MSSRLTEETPIKRIYNKTPWPADDPEDTYTKWYNSVIEKTPSELSPYDVIECLIHKLFVDTAIETGLFYLTENVLAGEYPGNILNLLSELDRDTLLPYADVIRGILTGANAVLAVPADNSDVWHDERIWKMFNAAVQRIMFTMGFSADDLTASGESTDIGSGWKAAERAAVEERATWHAPQYEPDGSTPPGFRRYVNILGIDYIELYGDYGDHDKRDMSLTGFRGPAEILYGGDGLYNAVQANDSERLESIDKELTRNTAYALILPGGHPEYITMAEQLQEWLSGMKKVREWLQSSYHGYYYSLPILERDMLVYVLEDMSD